LYRGKKEYIALGVVNAAVNCFKLEERDPWGIQLARTSRRWNGERWVEKVGCGTAGPTQKMKRRGKGLD
jgi:hypothetical protein